MSPATVHPGAPNATYPQALYRYHAARADGSVERGTVGAESDDAARALLSARGLYPLTIAREASGKETRRRIPASELALGFRILATLLESGLPMGKALAALGDLVPESWRAGLSTIREAVREGQSLAAALAGSPLAVPEDVLGIVRAGEGGSGLARAVRRAAELLETRAATRAAVRSALAYPVVLALAGLGSLALLVGVVLPRFALILAVLGQALPPSTRLVLSATSAARTGAIPVLSILAIGYVLWRAWVAGTAGREQWHAWLLTLPVLGATRRSAATARASAALSALLESGIPVAPALLHAAGAAGDAAVTARLMRARELVVRGQRISAALGDTQAVTPTAIRLVRAGEETGQLAQMLGYAGRLEEERTRELVRGAVRLLEPALILSFGAVVALVAAALLQAMYSVRPTP